MTELSEVFDQLPVDDVSTITKTMAYNGTTVTSYDPSDLQEIPTIQNDISTLQGETAQLTTDLDDVRSNSGYVLLKTFTVEALPLVTPDAELIFVSNGAAGNPVIAFSDGSSWIRCDNLQPVSN